MASRLSTNRNYSSNVSEKSNTDSSRSARTITLNICHLYPDLMDTYGDKGNIISIVKRCEWRNIETTISHVSLNDKLDPEKFDIYFFGGGQDRQQSIVAIDLKNKGELIKNAVENGAVLLSVCGGYQLLQHYFKTREGEKIPGIGLFDAYTVGSTTRMIQNLLVEISPQIQKEIIEVYSSLRGAERRSNLKTEIRDPFASLRMTREGSTLIGFENHSGKTYLSSTLKPLGKVIKGSGNNGEDKTEGAVYKNAFGCYLHGSLLPKNPHFADYLISKSLERRFGKVKLKPLDDSIEWQAHKQAVKRSRRTD